MRRVEETLDIVYDGLVNKDFDGVYGVFGDEGLGKSNFIMWMIEYWVRKKYGEVKPEDIKYIELDIVRWANGLSNVSNADIMCWDEGGEMSNKRSISKLNVAIAKAYQIIRGDNILSIIGMPSPFDLDSFFTGRRMRGMFFVYKRGKIAFWNRERLRKVINKNAYRRSKSVWVVKPNYHDTFPKYNGILKEPYLEKKKEFMKNSRKELAKTIREIKGNDDVPSDRDQAIARLHENLGTSKTAEAFGLSDRQIRRIVKKVSQGTGDVAY